jgi:hypothetical protein
VRTREGFQEEKDAGLSAFLEGTDASAFLTERIAALFRIAIFFLFSTSLTGPRFSCPIRTFPQFTFLFNESKTRISKVQFDGRHFRGMARKADLRQRRDP